MTAPGRRHKHHERVFLGFGGYRVPPLFIPPLRLTCPSSQIDSSRDSLLERGFDSFLLRVGLLVNILWSRKGR